MNATEGPVIDDVSTSDDQSAGVPEHHEPMTPEPGQRPAETDVQRPDEQVGAGDEQPGEQTAERSSDMALEGTGDMVFRVVGVYVFAFMVVGLDWALAKVDGAPRLHYVPLTQSAPVLTAGATIALGLHVAVYNLTHGSTIEPYTGRILARLRLFADTGLAVAILAAGSGVLMLLPTRSGGVNPNPPLDVLGFALSAVVAATACLAAHIIPADVTSRVATTQRSRDERWLGRAVRYWDGTHRVSLVSWAWRVAYVMALVVAPLGLVELFTHGFDLGRVWDGVVAGAAFALLPTMFLIGFAALLHRDYVFAFVLSAMAISGTVFIVLLLVGDLASVWQQLLAVGCALWPWWILLRTAAPPSRRRLRLIPRVTRRWIWWSLNWRYSRLGPRDKAASRLSLFLAKVTRRALRWYKRATGRTEHDALVKHGGDRNGTVTEATTQG